LSRETTSFSKQRPHQRVNAPVPCARCGMVQVCGRLPDCPHLHVVFTVPEEFHGFFEANYRTAVEALFGAATEALKLFQKNNWRMEGGFLAVLHT